MSPAEKEFILQDSLTADFKLYLPPPDLAVKSGTINVGTYYDDGIKFEFEINNKGYLASTKGKVALTFDQPCCPGDCVKESEVPVIPAQGNTKVSIEKSYNAGGRGCPFTATLSLQPYEVKSEDNKVMGMSPNLRLPDLKIEKVGNLIYVRNKGTATADARLTWLCYCPANLGNNVCKCPPLQPATASSPTLNAADYCNYEVTRRADLPVNGEWVYSVPKKPNLGCEEGLFSVRSTSQQDYLKGDNAVAIRYLID
jgi:hypothetical protein